LRPCDAVLREFPAVLLPSEKPIFDRWADGRRLQ
jgi:hypothetical protein